MVLNTVLRLVPTRVKAAMAATAIKAAISAYSIAAVAKLPTPSQQSLFALGWLNFFLSGMQSAFGPIAAAYLAAQGWTAKDIGFVLTIGGSASLVSQAPGGELVDAVRAKRLLVETGVVTIALSVLIFRFWLSFPLVALAEMLQGITSGVLGQRSLRSPSDWSGTPGVATVWTEPTLRGRRLRRVYAGIRVRIIGWAALSAVVMTGDGIDLLGVRSYPIQRPKSCS
jgi:hypothetical protein